MFGVQMTRTVEQLRRYRKRFAWVFLVSFLLLVASTVYWFSDQTSAPPPISPNLAQGEPPANGPTMEGLTSLSALDSLPILISVVALLTSFTSFVGFFFTTALAWRKERREQLHAQLDLEKKRLEIEKLRQEVGEIDVPSQDAKARGENA